MKRIIAWISIVVLLLAWLPANIAIKKFRLSRLDHNRVLAACRKAIADRNSYRNDRHQWGELDKEAVLVHSPLPNDVPEAIRDLNPSYILIHKDDILINFNVPFARIAILGFEPGVRQYGTIRYIDGLWFWNGNDKSSASSGN